jgi:hypothetical protein
MLARKVRLFPCPGDRGFESWRVELEAIQALARLAFMFSLRIPSAQRWSIVSARIVGAV